MAVSLPGIYSRLSVKVHLPPPALHFLLWIAVGATSSLILFSSIYARIYGLMFDPVLQQTNGAYPLAMLLFLVLWLGINSDAIRERLRADVDGFNPLPTAMGIGFAVGALGLSVGSAFLPASLSEWELLIQLMVILIWFEGLALIFANSTGLFALRYLAIFVPTASIQYLASTFLDAQVSFAFLSIFYPVLLFLGYPVTLDTSIPSQQLIFIHHNWGPSGNVVTLWINSGCTGLPALSVFLLLAGLIYIDAKPKKKVFIPSVILGLVFVLLLNMFRLIVLVQQALAASDVGAANNAVESVHSWIGYAIYSVFYVAYVFIMLLPRFRQEEDSSHGVSKIAD